MVFARSPNFHPQVIPVEFVVIHYTGCPFDSAHRKFMDAKHEVSSHFLIHQNGTTLELVDCLNGKPHRAWHAGKSRWVANGKTWEGFNDFSIGIEVENLNGNVFEYTGAQYKSLRKLMEQLKRLYPALRSPARVVGHEQIASGRGKADPGLCFDWARFFAECYPGQKAPKRKAVCPASVAAALAKFKDVKNLTARQKRMMWRGVGHTLEAAIKNHQSALGIVEL